MVRERMKVNVLDFTIFAKGMKQHLVVTYATKRETERKQDK